MEQPLIVYKDRTNVIPMSLGYDASQDTFVSEIREAPSKTSDLVATWGVSFETDGVDGELRFTLDNEVAAAITQVKGYMDVKRVTGGEPVPAFEGYLEVLFKETITV